MDDTTIQTPEGPVKLHVCKDGDSTDTAWVSIYEASFPPDQRQPIDQLAAQLSRGAMELDETRDENGTVLCMTLSEIFRPAPQAQAFVLACYTAVVPQLRGLGIGSVHRRKLEQLLRQEYGTYLGLFTEIESTKDATADPELLKTRVRRKNFFLKLGLIPLDVPYVFPSYDGGVPLEGELLWFPFGSDSIDAEVLQQVVYRIYTEGYAQQPGGEFVKSQMEKIKEAVTGRV